MISMSLSEITKMKMIMMMRMRRLLSILDNMRLEIKTAYLMVTRSGTIEAFWMHSRILINCSINNE